MYKVLFEKPIGGRLVFEIDFTADDFNIKNALEQLSYLHRDAIVQNSLADLWSRYSALEPISIAGLLFSPQVVSFLKKELKGKFDTKFEDDEIIESLTEVVCGAIPADKLKIPKFKPTKKKTPKASTDKPADSTSTTTDSPSQESKL